MNAHKMVAPNENRPSILSQIATGAVFTTVTLLINRASGMLLQMILVRMITVDQFGLFKLAIELSSFGIMFVTFFVGGVSASSTTRVVSVHMASESRERIRSTVIASLMSVAAMSLILSFVIYQLIPSVLARVFDIRTEILPEAISFFRWLLLYIFLSCIGMVVSAALRSCNFFRAYSVTESLTNLLRLLLIPALLYLGSGLNGIALGWGAALLIGILPGLWILETFTRVSRGRTFLSNSLMADFRELTTFGIPVFVSTLSSTIYYSADTLILGYYMPIKYVGIYSAGVVLVHSLLYLFSGLETALFPILSSSLENKEEGQEGRILEKGYRLLCIATFPVAVYAFAMAPYLVRFLFGTDYLEAATPSRILAILILAWAAMPAGIIFMSTGRPEINARLSAVSAVLNVMLNFMLIPLFGIIGAALSGAVSRLYGSMAGVRIGRNLFGAAFPFSYSMRILFISIVSVLPALGAFWILPPRVSTFGETFLVLAFSGLLFAMIFGTLLLKSGTLGQNDRRVIQALLSKTPLKVLNRLLWEK